MPIPFLCISMRQVSLIPTLQLMLSSHSRSPALVKTASNKMTRPILPTVFHCAQPFLWILALIVPPRRYHLKIQTFQICRQDGPCGTHPKVSPIFSMPSRANLVGSDRVLKHLSFRRNSMATFKIHTQHGVSLFFFC